MARNLLGIRQLSVEQIQQILALARTYKSRVTKGEKIEPMSDLVLGMLFFENSTRTRVSFEQAAHYLGIKTTTFAASSSSMSKGETLKDTILTLRYERLNGLVLRHRFSGAPTLAARYFGGPVLNAGDGQHEHPTQALADALTILEKKGQISGLRVAIVGDIDHSRVARSNAWLLSKLSAEVRFVGPRTLMPGHPGLLPCQIFYDLSAGIQNADVVIALRLQHERMLSGMSSSVHEFTKMYQINRSSLKNANPECLVLHPGPINRGVELDDTTADSSQSMITTQVENGIFVRMAAISWVFCADEPFLQSADNKAQAKHAKEPSKVKQATKKVKA